MLETKSEQRRIKVDDKFAEILWSNYEDFKKVMEEKTGKNITFIEYTGMLGSLKSLTTPIFVQIQPIKKGKFSKQVTLDLREIL